MILPQYIKNINLLDYKYTSSTSNFSTSSNVIMLSPELEAGTWLIIASCKYLQVSNPNAAGDSASLAIYEAATLRSKAEFTISSTTQANLTVPATTIVKLTLSASLTIYVKLLCNDPSAVATCSEPVIFCLKLA